MKRRHVFVLAAAVALATPAAVGPSLFRPLLVAPAWAVVTFDKSELTIESDGKTHKFSIEIARTPEQSQQGLMFRTRMAADAGMLFLYKPAQQVSMWMYQTLIPLDMLFIAGDGKVVNIHERAIPGSTESISSAGPVRAVLELNGGTVSRLKLKPGDRVVHPEIGK